MLPPAQIGAMVRLEAAINLEDGKEVEAAMNILRTGVCSEPHAELRAEMCSLLVRLLNAPWHTKHEVVVACIAAFRCANAVPALEEAAHASMTSNDGYPTVARMCTRALALAHPTPAPHSNGSQPLVTP